jgi:hypothetical protein
MKQSKFPPGWDEERVKRVLAHYESQTEEEAVAEDESSFETLEQTVMEIPTELVPKVRELIAKHRAAWTTANQALERNAANSAAPLSLGVIAHKHEIEHLLTELFRQYDPGVIGNNYLIKRTTIDSAGLL